MAESAGPAPNRKQVLESLGRAAAPPVRERDEGPTLGRLTGLLSRVEPASVLLVGSRPTAARLRAVRPVVPAVPGLTAELAALLDIEVLVVEARAFRTGPWLGADSHQSRHLAEEIFEAGRRIRQRGAQAFFVPNAPLEGTMLCRLRSTFTVDFAEVPRIDYAEGAKQSTLWRTIETLMSEPGIHADPIEEPQA